EEPPKRVLWSSIPDFMDDSGSRPPPSISQPAAALSPGEAEPAEPLPQESVPPGPGLGTRLQARIAGLFAWHPETEEAPAAAVPPQAEPVPGPPPPPPAESISAEPEIESAAEDSEPSAADPPPAPADHAPLAAAEPEPAVEPAADQAAPAPEPQPSASATDPQPDAPPGRDLHRLGIILVVAASLPLIVVAVLLWAGTRNLPGAGDDRAAAPLGRDREQVAFVTASLLNCRSAPARQSESLSVMRRGDAVSLLARDGEWISVANEGGQCWVLARYLSLQPPL
ncbi:MAG TPA: SH3 domain-containing protein, partial [Allosphingosinicella sp.]